MRARIEFLIVVALIAVGLAPWHAARADACQYLRNFAQQAWQNYRTYAPTDASSAAAARLADARNAQNAADAQCNLQRQSNSMPSVGGRLGAISNALGLLGSLGSNSDGGDDGAADRARANALRQQAEQQRAAEAEAERQAEAARQAAAAQQARQAADAAERCNAPGSFGPTPGCGSNVDNNPFGPPVKVASADAARFSNQAAGASSPCSGGSFEWSCCPKGMTHLDCVQNRMLGPKVLQQVSTCGLAPVLANSIQNAKTPVDYSHDVLTEQQYEQIGRGEATYADIHWQNMEAWVQSIQDKLDEDDIPPTLAMAMLEQFGKIKTEITACKGRQ